ncbi:hypothetical protein Q3A66_12135 [Hymenobacter sp. BT770]|uniref:hypothetical protein n=1 Tax=Hymenobacter sp. BT770 TaxID=2886942 RepID=UPI001D1260E9|nr:hypothetical protein [Hymenobacter sp. BT770]MCC3153581.1 hypothetical protein [Hymenobacter sp. BT770]MDO3415817.1 hypothetical protein [Hymenobacter sp. BT770]
MDASFWLVWTGQLSRIILLAVGLLGLARYRQLPSGLRYLVGLVWFGLTIEVCAKVLHDWKGSNLLLAPIDAAGELWLLSLVYAWALDSATFSRLRPWLFGAFVLYAGFTVALAPEFTRFKTGVMVLESLGMMLLAGLYFRKLLNELQVPRLSQAPMFWVSTGLLLYALGKFLIALFSNYMLAHYSLQLSLVMWTIHAMLIVVLYLGYGRALWMRPQR